MSVDRILLTGSSGLIGTSLVRSLRRNRIAMVTVRRHPLPGTGDEELLWDPYAPTPLSHPEALEGITAAVHLSGANLAGRRWTSSYKREIVESRVTPTHALATLLAGLGSKPAVLVCASATGIYGDRGDEVLTEASLPGSGFIPDLCLCLGKGNPAGHGCWNPGGASPLWSSAFVPGGRPGADAAHLPRRSGWPFRQRPAVDQLGRAAGCDSDDRVCAGDQGISGPVNRRCAQPGRPIWSSPVRSAAPSTARRLLRVPAFALRLAFGEMAEATILQSERACRLA